MGFECRLLERLVEDIDLIHILYHMTGHVGKDAADVVVGDEVENPGAFALGLNQATGTEQAQMVADQRG